MGVVFSCLFICFFLLHHRLSRHAAWVFLILSQSCITSTHQRFFERGVHCSFSTYLLLLILLLGSGHKLRYGGIERHYFLP